MIQENYDYVQKGFRILVASMSAFIGQEMNRKYNSRWWYEVLDVLNDKRDLKCSGDYGELVDSLDIANCIRIIDRKWNDVFKEKLPHNCRTWAKELMGVRNIVSHIGQSDLEQPMAERALDTMALLCKEIDPEGAEEIRIIYKEVRARAEGENRSYEEYTGLKQPESDSVRGELKEGSLLQLIGTDKVQKTVLTRKVSFGGQTIPYPVYRVRLDALYYNDQNDRIATWITQYESENGNGSLSELDKDIYNRIIENFVVESNPDSIIKTQKNISIVGQREPGVTLADGRIVDGNRRYTCLRRLQRDNTEPLYFETVIMDMDIREDKKKIKLLELAIQHGEEKKVDYDLIDYAIGTYRDVVQTGLLSVEEYAESTNEGVAEVKKRIEIAKIVCEFLSYIKLPEQYHVAREFQVYSLFQEMMPLLKKLDQSETMQLKTIVFNNAMMHAIPDQRKFIRDIKGLINNETYKDYFVDQEKWNEVIRKQYSEIEIRNKDDVDRFASSNVRIAEELQMSMQRALLKHRSHVLKLKPVENMSKCRELMMDVDARMFKQMDIDEKESLKGELDEIIKIASGLRRLL